MKRKLSLLISFVVVLLVAFVPKAEDPLDRLVDVLQRWSDEHPQEKVYVHTDRPYYTIGDTIWFKGYVTIGSAHQLSAKSGALYVELITEKDSVYQLLKLPVTIGMAKGCFVLDPALQAGNYRIRSYTQWMRNAGPDYFYDHTFVVDNPPKERVFTHMEYGNSGEGDQGFPIAVLNYTDSSGKPLNYLPLKYNLRKNYNTIFKGQGVTDEKGNYRVELKGFTWEELKGAHLTTSLEMEDLSSVARSFPIKWLAKEADLQFFPEGGQMLQGFSGKVAFKATGPNGKGLAVKGVLLDGESREIARLESNRFGMGYFVLRPEQDKRYKVRLSFPDGSTKLYDLPVADQYGYTLSADYHHEADSIAIQVNGKLPYVMPRHELYLLVQSRGNVYYTAKIPVSGVSVSLQVSAKSIPSGVAQLTLFSSSGEPLNERIVFVEHDDQMNVRISTSKQVYRARERVDVELDAVYDGEEPVDAADFSVTVVNEDRVPSDESMETTIFSHMLLSSDIRGYIEQPNYYFHRTSSQTRKDLDVLMLTQGYRRFAWKKLVGGQPEPLLYPPETLITEVTGRLRGLWWQKVKFGNVFLMNNMLGLTLVEKTDQEGRFKFQNLVITEGLRFSVHGRKSNNGHRLEILLDKFALQKLTTNVNLPDLRTDFRKVIRAVPEPLTKEEQARIQYRITTGKLLREVKIKGRLLRPSLQALKGYISETVIFNELDSGKNIYNALKDRNLKGITLRKWAAYLDHEPMTILINDRRYEGDAVEDVLQWDVEDVIKVDIVRSPELVTPTMFIYTRSIYVRRPVDPLDPNSPSIWAPDIINIFPRGFDKVREFYAPRYEGQPGAQSTADTRTTVYWNPSVKVDAGSGAFSFYNGDRKGNYRIVVEGINADGLLGRQVYRFKLE